jgi:hypothetical protein
MNGLDISGLVFGKLTAISHVSGSRNEKRKWRCMCECGTETTVETNKLTSGHTKSCGCLVAKTSAENGRMNKTHGLGHGKGTTTYISWNSMRYRCSEGYKGRKHYADRGISVCVRWDAFESFLADMGERPNGTTLDRIDVNGNYEPGNCRWATAKEQQRNKTNTNYLYVDGEKRVAMDIAEEIGVKPSAMKYFVSVARKMVKIYGCVPTP